MSEMKTWLAGKDWSRRGVAQREEAFPTDEGYLLKDSFSSDFQVLVLAEQITNMNSFDPNTPGEGVIFLFTHRFGDRGTRARPCNPCLQGFTMSKFPCT